MTGELAHKDVSLVITSCRRFDLLQLTVDSMRPWLARFPRRIVVEDSDCRPTLLDALEAEGFTVLVNGARLGQHASIDRAYHLVDTEFIFHCEDDWHFLTEPNVSAAQHILTRGLGGHRRFSVVTFRDSTRKPKHDQRTYCECDVMGNRYRWSLRQESRYNSFTFNPSLLRRNLIETTGPYASFLTEGSIARYLRRRGYVVATQIPSVVRHLGVDRGTQRTRHGWRARLDQWIRKGV